MKKESILPKLLRIMTAIFVTGMILSIPFSVFAEEEKEKKEYMISAGNANGTFYPVSVAISSAVQSFIRGEESFSLQVMQSAGGGENVLNLKSNKAQFGLIQGLVGYFAWNGEGAYKETGPVKEIRSICSLWQNVRHFVLRSSLTKSGDVSDLVALQGQKLAVGNKNSGNAISNAAVLKNLGIDMQGDYSVVYGDRSATISHLEHEEIIGLGMTSSVPMKEMTEIFTRMGSKATLLNFTPAQAEVADGGFHIWTPYTIPKGTYPSVNKDINTIAQPTILAVRADVDEEVVYQLTKVLYKHLSFVTHVHKALRKMSLDNALDGLPIPLHPGAVRYFKEVGLTIPEELLPE